MSAVEALRLDDVHKSFGHDEVLKGLDLSVAEHEVICLIGASGSGKTTMLRCINLLEPIDSGRILEEGPPDRIFSEPQDARTRQFLQRIIEAGRL